MNPLLNNSQEFVVELKMDVKVDARGSFLKYFHAGQETFKVEELFLSETNPGMVRGIHLQLGKSASKRLILNISGEIFTVFVDLRIYSPTFGQFKTFRTRDGEPRGFLVPEGVAHGYQAITRCLVNYASSNNHDPVLDGGVNPLSLGINWPAEVSGLSNRDKNLPSLDEFIMRSKL